jgi:hypothetical protein
VICEEDPVIDYMIMEAVLMKVRKQDEDYRKEQERKEWKTRRNHLPK